MPEPFPLGIITGTHRAVAALSRANQEVTEFLTRHQHGDWGEIEDEDTAANEDALVHAGRLLSRYTLSTGVQLLVLTEGDRSGTTILVAEEAEEEAAEEEDDVPAQD